MSLRERLAEMFGIWLCVYPSVLGMSYAVGWLGLGWPLYAEILVSTTLTVPLISFVAVPRVRGSIATAEGTSKTEIAWREARQTEQKEAVRKPGR